jgi:hypothetical protein
MLRKATLRVADEAEAFAGDLDHAFSVPEFLIRPGLWKLPPFIEAIFRRLTVKTFFTLAPGAAIMPIVAMPALVTSVTFALICTILALGTIRALWPLGTSRGLLCDPLRLG